MVYGEHVSRMLLDRTACARCRGCLIANWRRRRLSRADVQPEHSQPRPNPSPKLMDSVQDLPTVALPCGVTLKFTMGESEDDLTPQINNQI
jgi:hypothetical protein